MGGADEARQPSAATASGSGVTVLLGLLLAGGILLLLFALGRPRRPRANGASGAGPARYPTAARLRPVLPEPLPARAPPRARAVVVTVAAAGAEVPPDLALTVMLRPRAPSPTTGEAVAPDAELRCGRAPRLDLGEDRAVEAVQLTLACDEAAGPPLVVELRDAGDGVVLREELGAFRGRALVPLCTPVEWRPWTWDAAVSPVLTHDRRGWRPLPGPPDLVARSPGPAGLLQAGPGVAVDALGVAMPLRAVAATTVWAVVTLPPLTVAEAVVAVCVGPSGYVGLGYSREGQLLHLSAPVATALGPPVALGSRAVLGLCYEPVPPHGGLRLTFAHPDGTVWRVREAPPTDVVAKPLLVDTAVVWGDPEGRALGEPDGARRLVVHEVRVLPRATTPAQLVGGHRALVRKWAVG